MGSMVVPSRQAPVRPESSPCSSGEPLTGSAEERKDDDRILTVMDARAEPAGLVPLARGRYDSFLTVLETLVNLDSGTLNTPGVTRMADACAARLATGGWEVERVPG